MEIKISVPEAMELIKGLQERPSRIFEMATMNVQKDVGDYQVKAILCCIVWVGRYKTRMKSGISNTIVLVKLFENMYNKHVIRQKKTHS